MNILKKLSAVLGLALIGSLLMATIVMANVVPTENYNLIFNGERVVFDAEAPPVISNGSTLLPLRFLFDLLDQDGIGQLDWSPAYQQVSITFGETTATLWIGEYDAVINDVNFPVTGAAPILFNDLTYVPLRFLAETFDMTVGWDAPSRTASAISNEKLDRITYLIENNKPDDVEDFRMSVNMISTISMTQTYDGEEETLSLKSEVTTRIDLSEMFSHAHVIATNEGESMVIDRFDDGEWLYLSADDMVFKVPSLLAQVEDIEALMMEFDAFASLELSREFYRTLRLEEVGAAYVVSGQVFISNDIFIELIDAIGGLEGILGDIRDMTIDIRSLNLRVSINRVTGLLVSTEIQFVVDISTEFLGEIISVNVQMNVNASNFNFDPIFETVVPQEIIDDAIEV